jgi:hypothetical protein
MIASVATRDLSRAKNRAEKLAIGEVAQLACAASGTTQALNRILTENAE